MGHAGTRTTCTRATDEIPVRNVWEGIQRAVKLFRPPRNPQRCQEARVPHMPGAIYVQMQLEGASFTISLKRGGLQMQGAAQFEVSRVCPAGGQHRFHVV